MGDLPTGLRRGSVTVQREPVITTGAFAGPEERAWSARVWEGIALWSLAGLVAILPYAHTGTPRSILFAIAIVGCLGLWYADPGRRWVKTPVDLPMLLFVCWSIVALVTALDVAYSAKEIKNELVANAVLFVLAVTAARRDGAVDALAWAVSLAGLVMGTYALVEYDWQYLLALSRGARTSSFTSNIIFFSSYLVLIIPVTFYLAMTARRSPAQWAAWSIWVVQMLALVTTVTRAAWLAVILQCLVYALLNNRRVFLGAVIFLAVVAGLVVFQPSLRQALIANGWFTDQGRTFYWEHLLPHLANSPVSGFGYGQQTPDRAAPGVRSATPAVDAPHAFNTFIQMALELGLVGLGLFCWVLWHVGFALWRGFRSAPAGSADSTWLVCILMVFAGFILRNQMDHLFRDFPGHLFWILMGLGVGRAVASGGARQRAGT